MGLRGLRTRCVFLGAHGTRLIQVRVSAYQIHCTLHIREHLNLLYLLGHKRQERFLDGKGQGPWADGAGTT